MNFANPLAVIKQVLQVGKVNKAKSVQKSLKDGDVVTREPVNLYRDMSLIRSFGSDYDVLKNLSIFDPDAAQALWTTLRFAETPVDIIFRDDKGEFDADKTREFHQFIRANWIIGANVPTELEHSSIIMRNCFLYGGLGAELVLNEMKLPVKIAYVHAKDIEWRYKERRMKPFQKATGGKEVDLDIPTFFYASTDTEIDQAQAVPPLISAVQAIAFKQQVITDIQRVVKRVGHPRIKVTLLEEVMIKNAPKEIRSDSKKLSDWLKARKGEIGTELSKLKPDDALIMFDSMEADHLESKTATIDYRPLVEILDGQVISALKSLPSILGKRSEGGSQNIASVETMVFLQTPIYLQRKSEKMLSQVYTMSARLLGFKGQIYVKHKPINLRPDLELEPQLLARDNRVLTRLSHGLLTDAEAALELGIMHLPKEELSGTGFMGGKSMETDTDVSPNSDPLGRSISGDGKKTGNTKGTQDPKAKNQSKDK